MFGETTISHVRIWNHPIETTIKIWLFLGRFCFEMPEAKIGPHDVRICPKNFPKKQQVMQETTYTDTPGTPNNQFLFFFFMFLSTGWWSKSLTSKNGLFHVVSPFPSIKNGLFHVVSPFPSIKEHGLFRFYFFGFWSRWSLLFQRKVWGAPIIVYLLPGTPNKQFFHGWKWWFPTISYIKIWNHPIEPTIHEWLFGVPGSSDLLCIIFTNFTWGRKQIMIMGCWCFDKPLFWTKVLKKNENYVFVYFRNCKTFLSSHTTKPLHFLKPIGLSGSWGNRDLFKVERGKCFFLEHRNSNKTPKHMIVL